MDKYVFPTSNGVVVHCQDKKVFSAINCDGQKRLLSFQEKNKVIFWHFPFFRGLQYFFCGLFALFSAFLLSYDICGGQKVKQADLKKYYTKKFIYLLITFVLAIVFSAIVLGYLPGKVGFLIVGYQGVTILRNLVILALKIALFYVFLLILRVFPVVNEFFRFNKASCDGKKIPLNFLNFVVFVFLLDFIVVTLVGAGFGFWFNLIFHIAVLLCCIMIGYEILNFISLFNFTRNFCYLTAFLVFSKPSITHVETAQIAYSEMNLLTSQKGREFMSAENHAFSVVYSEVKNRLAAAGINEKSETDWLIATVLGKNRAEIKLISSVTEKQYQDILKATSRRAKGESLDNIFGYTEFFGLRFDVNKKVLTPRMETELLVEQVLKAAKDFKQPTILDLGTGSGAIAISIAKNCDAKVCAIDISKPALQTAENNAKKNDVKIEFLHSNLFDGLKRKKKFDIIVSNPPYVATADIKKLDKNVRECDPLISLDGGEDGLDFYRAIVPASVKRLNGGGLLFFEVGKGQAAAVRKLLRESGFENIKTIKDYNNIERIVYGKHR